MKKVLFGVVGLVLVLAAVVLVGPGLIDWNDYREQIAARAEALTGRTLVIAGDIRITLLPAPALVVNDVTLANMEGATAAEMVRLKSLEIRIALGPLLGGEFQVETIKLVEPVIELEILGDGRRNWDFAAKSTPGPGAVTAADGAGKEGGQAASGGSQPSVRLDNFTVENGMLVFRDSRKGTIERVAEINARLAAQSLDGPFESSGRLVARGIPLRYEVSVGKVIEERTVPVTLTVTGAPGGTGIQIGGALLNLANAPRFKGKVKGEGDKLSDLIAAAGLGGPLPGFLDQAFGFEGTVTASASGAEFKDFALRLGNTRATGNVLMKLGDAANVTVRVAVNHIDMDKWLALPAATGGPAAAGGTGRPKQRASLVLRRPAAGSTEDRAPGFSLPADIDGSLDISVEAITFKGGIVGQARLIAELTNGEVTVSQLSAQFPGGSDVAVFGFLTAQGGKPRFEGEVEALVSDSRGVLSWLGHAMPGVPDDRLRRLTLAGKFWATPDRIEATDVDFQFDSSRLTGTLSAALGGRPALSADVVLDRINLDAYLPPSAPAAAGAAPEAKADGPKRTPAPTATRLAAGPPVPSNVLGAFDATLKARIKTVVYRGTSIKDVVFDGVLTGEALQVRRLSVAKLAGASATISGTLKGLSGVPEMEAVRFDVRANDPSRLFRLAGIDSPVPPKKLGKVALKGRADGSLLRPVIDVTVNAAGAEVSLAGTVSVLPIGPRFDLKVTVKHPDLPRLVRVFGADYRTATPLGGLDIAAQVKGDASALTLSDVKGKVGPVPVEGTVTVDLAGPRPKITADLKTGEIVVDRFLPARRTASLPETPGRPFAAPRLIPASWAAPPRPAAAPGVVRVAARTASGGERWSPDPIDLSALKTFDAALTLNAAAITYQKYRLGNANLAATVADGVLTAERLSGVIFGGALQANARVDAASLPRIQAVLSLRNVDVGEAGRAVSGKSVASGRMDMDLRLATTGRSVADMVRTLSGNGSLAMRGLEVQADATGTALAGALNLVAGLNRLGDALGGRKRGKGLADITGTFKIERGVARSEDMRLVSNVGTGRARGSVDLPGWRIDVDGEMRLSQNVVTALLSQATGTAQTAQVVPFRIKGPLDAPDVKLDMSSLQGVGLRIPGVEKLLRKEGIGDVLRGVLGVPPGGQPQGQQPAPPRVQAPPPPQDAPPEPPPPPPEQKKIRPSDILKQLFKIR
ncbi:MAG: AsmA family protein [Proteobacteria bacterium]|nr:AsmA family protein [Pseudomonadota bacterium]